MRENTERNVPTEEELKRREREGFGKRQALDRPLVERPDDFPPQKKEVISYENGVSLTSAEAAAIQKKSDISQARMAEIKGSIPDLANKRHIQESPRDFNNVVQLRPGNSTIPKKTESLSRNRTVMETVADRWKGLFGG